ncbi:MAG: CBS domain-containing protein, partial [Eudoraea sp.]|nr:CBS domain-containing protein [Eudoraea sp.]
EITGGYQLFVPLMITAAISYLISKNTLEHNIYTRELAKIGALITHDKDQTVLSLMQLDEVIERNFKEVRIDMTLGEMLHDTVSKSGRNLFPVVNEEGVLMGVVNLDDIRSVMFDSSMYDKVTVGSFMHNAPEHIFYESDNMQQVMQKFQRSDAWNLPVIRGSKYYGFVSRSKLLTAYRIKLINFTS